MNKKAWTHVNMFQAILSLFIFLVVDADYNAPVSRITTYTMYAKYEITMIAPIAFPRDLFFAATAQHTTVATITAAISIALLIMKPIGLIDDAIPSTNKMLNTLEPIALPSAISTSPLRAATKDVTSSGREVPRAIIVRPIILSLTPRAKAITHTKRHSKC